MLYQDQLGRTIFIGKTPNRIISLVPSITELLLHTGQEDKVIGRTKFCVHPKNIVQHIEKIGGTKNPHIAKIEKLAPDLIIANKEENRKEDISKLEKICPVWVSDVGNYQDCLDMISLLGQLLDNEANSQNLTQSIRQKRNKYTQSSPSPMSCLYFIWKNPWMVTGTNTYIHDMLSEAGFVNIISNTPRYPVLSDNQITKLQPDIVFLSSEPFPFQEKHIDELKKLLPKSQILLVDGEMFSWYGYRLLHSYDYFEKIKNRLTK